MAKSAQLVLENGTYDLDVHVGTENEKAIDITQLRAQTGHITLDNGFKNTGATKSAITYLDGENGKLNYRGYPIEQLAEKSTFLEVAYLLIYGELPSAVELDDFINKIKNHVLVTEQIRGIIQAFPQNSHPMCILGSVVGGLNAMYPSQPSSKSTEEQLNDHISRLMGKLPTIVAWSYKYSLGQPVVYPKLNLDYVTNFLHMLYAHPLENYDVDPIITRALDKLLILHADHEQNCSTSTVRIIGSSQASLYSAISGGINALWGPLHGGANQAVIEMLEQIREDGGSVDKYVAKAKDKNDPFRLMGFGHRVYKNFDPRARIVKKSADEVLELIGVHDPLLEIAKKLEEIALKDEYFIEKKLYPNIDFYSGIIYKAIGLPIKMYTPMFAFGRLAGWISQWKEMIGNSEPIGRPRQLYVGENTRNYIDIDKR